MLRPKLPPYQKSKSINKPSKKHILLTNTLIKDLPNGTEPLEHQVAGHTFQVGTDAIGMLKNQYDGSVMKAAVKPMCGSREIKFYEQLQLNTTDQNMEMLKKLVPEYRGTVKLPFRGKMIDFIKLADISHDMSEPCIIDIKIGKRTWDPFASTEKILTEEQKYKACKENLGICVPGFQVYDIKSGRIKRYGKDYGKKLNQDSVKDALKIFLNAETGLCRQLLMQLLSVIWTIQNWARTQTSLRLYSSSLLLAYDARRLKNNLLFSRSNSNHSTNSTSGSLSPQSGGDGKIMPIFQWPQTDNNSPTTDTGETIQLYKKVQRNHSVQNNYDEDLKDIRKNYAFLLHNLIGGLNDNDNNKEWAFAKMIDFAHVFPAEDDSIDKNYLFGIDNLVKILEGFLQECE